MSIEGIEGKKSFMKNKLIFNSADGTLPLPCSRLASLRLMWRSTLVSPLLISLACHRVSPPSATATELQNQRVRAEQESRYETANQLQEVVQVVLCRAPAHLVRTQRKMMHLWATLSLGLRSGGGVWKEVWKQTGSTSDWRPTRRRLASKSVMLALIYSFSRLLLIFFMFRQLFPLVFWLFILPTNGMVRNHGNAVLSFQLAGAN